MGDTIAKALDWIKSPRQSAIVFLATALLLALPSSAVGHLGLAGFERYRGWAAVLAMLSGATLIVESTTQVWVHFSEKRKAQARQKTKEESLRNLSAEEKGILIRYMVGSSDTQYLLTNDGNVGALLSKSVLYMGSKTGQMTPHGPMTAINIQPWAKEYLNQHPELLDYSQVPNSPPSPFASWS